MLNRCGEFNFIAGLAEFVAVVLLLCETNSAAFLGSGD